MNIELVVTQCGSSCSKWCRIQQWPNPYPGENIVNQAILYLPNDQDNKLCYRVNFLSSSPGPSSSSGPTITITITYLLSIEYFWRFTGFKESHRKILPAILAR